MDPQRWLQPVSITFGTHQILLKLFVLEERRLRPAGTLLAFQGVLTLHNHILIHVQIYESHSITVFSLILRRVSDVGREYTHTHGWPEHLPNLASVLCDLPLRRRPTSAYKNSLSRCGTFERVNKMVCTPRCKNKRFTHTLLCAVSAEKCNHEYDQGGAEDGAMCARGARVGTHVPNVQAGRSPCVSLSHLPKG